MLNAYNWLHRKFSIHFPRLYGLVVQNRKFVKYVISGCIAAAVSLSVSFVLTDIVGLWYLVSVVVAFIAGLITSFILQKFWTFRQRSLGNVKMEFVLYIIVALAALLINTTVVYLLVEFVAFWYILAQVAAGLVVVGFNLFFYERLVFKTKSW